MHVLEEKLKLKLAFISSCACLVTEQEVLIMHDPLRVQIGPTVKQYGRFHLKRHDSYRGSQAMHSTHYFVVLENEDGSEEHLGILQIQESSLPELLNYLHRWLQRQYTYVFQAKQQLGQTAEDDEAKASWQYHLESLERRYNYVVHAIREIVSDYRPDESISNLSSGLTEEENCDLPDGLDHE